LEGRKIMAEAVIKIKADPREAQRAIKHVERSFKKLRRAADEAAAAIERLGKAGLSFRDIQRDADSGP
jgi:hypothetical protein